MFILQENNQIPLCGKVLLIALSRRVLIVPLLKKLIATLCPIIQESPANHIMRRVLLVTLSRRVLLILLFRRVFLVQLFWRVLLIPLSRRVLLIPLFRWVLLIPLLGGSC